MTTRFFNARIWDFSAERAREAQLTEESGVIRAVSFDKDPLPADRSVDCGGRLLLSGFVDSHMHLPGSQLYRRHGVYLMECTTLAEYQRALLPHRNDQGILRGFGWNQQVFQEDPAALAQLRRFLDETFPQLPVALFSDDYHSCLCNACLLRQAEEFLPAQTLPEDGLLTERMVFALMDGYPPLAFARQDVEDALLACQELYLSRGITAVQSLMAIGMEDETCLDAVCGLAEQGEWHLHVNFAVTAHPGSSPRKVLETLRTRQRRQGPLVRLDTVKIYADGVVDNASAFLLKPYSDCRGRGIPIWEEGELERFCTFFDREGVQIHVHVIGDGAAEEITWALERAMAQNGRVRNENRHVLAHCQLVDEAAAERMGRLGLYAALQPFWFPGKRVYGVDAERLGDRAEACYPCASLLERGAVVTLGSDLPVTPDPSPLVGMACAMNRRKEEERLTFSQALEAYTAAGMRQLGQGDEAGIIAPGYRADFVLVDGASEDFSADAVARMKVARTYVGGQCVYEREACAPED